MSKITSAMAVLGVVAGLGVAALPLSSYAADRAESNQVTVRAFVNSALAISTNEVDLVDFGTVSIDNEAETIQTIDVTVSGSITTYNLGVMDYDQDTNMNWVAADGAASADGTPSKEIPTKGGETLVGGWGFRLEDRHAAGADPATDVWKAMPIYNAENATTNLVDGGTLNRAAGEGVEAIDGEVTTNVQFGININTLTLENGRYEDQVVFVATSGA